MANEHLKVFPPESIEFQQLQMAALLLNQMCTDRQFHVEVTYYDFGQHWLYTTLIATDSDSEMTYQALQPKEQKILITNQPISPEWQAVIQALAHHKHL